MARGDVVVIAVVAVAVAPMLGMMVARGDAVVIAVVAVVVTPMLGIARLVTRVNLVPDKGFPFVLIGISFHSY